MEILVPILLLTAVLFFSGFYIKENFFNTVQCGSITNCERCSETGKCAWCLNTKACVPTDRFGFPAGRQCNGNDVVSFPNNCKNLPTNQGRPQTISVRSGSNVNDDITDLSGQPAWLVSALKGGFVSGLKSGYAQDYRNWIARDATLQPNSIGGLGTRTGTTYDTGDMSRAFYDQFGQNATSASLESRSESDITRDILDNYSSPELGNSGVQSASSAALESLIKRLVAEQLRRNGLDTVDPFQDINSTKKLAKEIAETIA
jgi:hypothetical protein